VNTHTCTYTRGGCKDTIQRVNRDMDVESYICISVYIKTYYSIYTMYIYMHKTQRMERNDTEVGERQRHGELYMYQCVCICIYVYCSKDRIYIDIHKTQRVERDRDMESYKCISVCVNVYTYIVAYAQYILIYRRQRGWRETGTWSTELRGQID